MNELCQIELLEIELFDHLTMETNDCLIVQMSNVEHNVK